MMTDAEFKLHMSVYLDGQMRPLKNEIKFLEKPTNIDLTEEYLKPIHENVLIIKNFIDEYRMTAEDRYVQSLQS